MRARLAPAGLPVLAEAAAAGRFPALAGALAGAAVVAGVAAAGRFPFLVLPDWASRGGTGSKLGCKERKPAKATGSHSTLTFLRLE